MAIITPQFDIKRAAGGFIANIFDNLPKPFRRDPKAQAILDLAPSGPVVHNYLSIENSTLYLHSKPLHTPAYVPEASFYLGDYSVTSLAAAINAGGHSLTATALGEQDGTKAVLLLGFVDQPLNAVDTVRVQIATARSWKFFYPIAQVLFGAEQAATDAESSFFMPFSKGFWLDFWGDWLNIPRLPGMTDSEYITYLIRTLRLPTVNNKAIEDILTAKFGLNAEVADSGYKQFTVRMDAVGMTLSSAEISSLVNKVKAAGVNWLLTYYSKNAEDFKAYFLDKSGGKPFRSSDTPKFGITHRHQDIYGRSTGGFMFNKSLVNQVSVGRGRTVVERKVEMFYNNRQDPSYTVL